MRTDYGQNATLWVNKPLPALPHGREIAANWITSNMFSQIDVLMEHCLTPYTPNAEYKTIQIRCQSSDLCLEEVSEMHVVNLRQQKSYHLTNYRQHAILLPFKTAMKVAKGQFEKNITSEPIDRKKSLKRLIQEIQLHCYKSARSTPNELLGPTSSIS
ncbi:hypothetical protein AC1031_016686 [Aphanomyces cochlioides]|nr:hypothetical protein AC1031_016686 [Aphanomyces cochlioides]